MADNQWTGPLLCGGEMSERRYAESAWLLQGRLLDLHRHVVDKGGQGTDHAWGRAWASMLCEQNRRWPFSNRWMSFILPVGHRTRNTTRSTLNNSPPPPGAQCWYLPLRRRACFRMHKYCQSTLSCRGARGTNSLAPTTRMPSVRKAALLGTGNINTIHRLDQNRDSPAILEMVESKWTGAMQRN